MTEVLNRELAPHTVYKILAKSKKTLFVVPVLVFILCAQYLHFTPTVYEGRIEFSPLTDLQIIDYKLLNDALAPPRDKFGNLDPSNTLGNSQENTRFISSEKALMEFISSFDSKEPVREALIKTHPSVLALENNLSVQRKLIDALSQNVRINILRKRIGGASVINYEIVIRHTDKDAAKELLDAYISSTFRKLRRQNLKAVASILKSIEEDNRFKILTIEQELETLKYQIELNLQQRLLILEEEASIARQLKLDKHLDGTIPTPKPTQTATDPTVNINFNNGRPEYLRGYIAIEKEMQNLRQRFITGNGLKFHPDYAILASQIEAIKNDKRTDHISRALSLSPLSDGGEFKPVNIETENMTFGASRNATLILTASVLVGFMLAIVLVLFRNIIDPK